MIKIFHGENLVASRQALMVLVKKAKKEGMEVVVLESRKATLAEVRLALTSDSLLGRNRLLIIENLLSGQTTAEKKKIIEYLVHQPFENDLVIWEEKEIARLPALPGVLVEVFKASRKIFPFLESLRPDNQKQMLTQLWEAKRTEESEMIFYMLIRQIRLLLLVKSAETTGLPSWQVQKLKTQASYFSLLQLKELYQKLLEIDYLQKTSGDPYLLSSRLDLLVASL